jgi:hypothetical protein
VGSNPAAPTNKPHENQSKISIGTRPSKTANENKTGQKCSSGDTNHPNFTRMNRRRSQMFRFEKQVVVKP